MSNQTLAEQLKNKQIQPTTTIPDEVLEAALGMPKGGLNSMLPKTPENTVLQERPSSEAIKAEQDRLATIEANIASLTHTVAGVKSSNNKMPSAKVEIDWTKMSESDAYKLSIPIDAVQFDLPDYMDVNLKDKNYEARWVNINPARQGPMRLVGFTEVKEQDLGNPLALGIHKNAEGHYRYIDVVLMKVHKSRLYGAYKANYQRSIALTNPNKLHELSKAKFNSFVQEAGPEFNPETGTTHNVQAEFRDSQELGIGGKKKMEVYI